MQLSMLPKLDRYQAWDDYAKVFVELLRTQSQKYGTINICSELNTIISMFLESGDKNDLTPTLGFFYGALGNIVSQLRSVNNYPRELEFDCMWLLFCNYLESLDMVEPCDCPDKKLIDGYCGQCGNLGYHLK
jgi:hypothetical protein